MDENKRVSVLSQFQERVLLDTTHVLILIYLSIVHRSFSRFFFQCTNKEFLAEEMCVCPIPSDPSREHK